MYSKVLNDNGERLLQTSIESLSYKFLFELLLILFLVNVKVFKWINNTLQDHSRKANEKYSF